MTRSLSLAVLMSLIMPSVVLAGCLFSDAVEPREVKMTSPPIISLDDMSQPEDMHDAPDMRQPQDMRQPPDMRQPEDMAAGLCGGVECSPGQKCREESCVDADSCDSQGDCDASMVCSMGRCVELLTDMMNCGELGFECKGSQACKQGMCTCNDGPLPAQQKTIVDASDNLRRYPHARMLNFYVPERFTCASGEPVETCPQGQLALNKAYGPKQPHYLVMYANSQDSLKVEVLDERGDSLEPLSETLQGAGSRDEKKLVDYRVVQGFESHFLLVWWSNGSREFVQIYELKASLNERVKITLIMDDKGTPTQPEDDEPIRFINTPDMFDFGFSLPVETTIGESTYEVFSFPHLVQAPEFNLNPLALNLSSVLVMGSLLIKKERLTGETQQVVVLQPTDVQTFMYPAGRKVRGVGVGDIRQVKRGFDVQAHFVEKTLYLSVTLGEDAPNRDDFNQLDVNYNHHVWTFDLERAGDATASLEPMQGSPWTLFTHTAPNAAKLFDDSANNGNDAYLPLPPTVFASEKPEEGVWASIGWSRSRASFGVNSQVPHSGQVISRTQQDQPVQKIPLGTAIPNIYVYDQSLSLDPLDAQLPVMFWLEAMQQGNDVAVTASEAKFALLTVDPMTQLPTPGQTKNLTKKHDAQRLSSQPGTRSTGVITHGSSAVYFHALVGLDPVCAFPSFGP